MTVLRLVLLGTLIPLVSLPAIAEELGEGRMLERRTFVFEDCKKSRDLDCLDIDTKDGNLARVKTIDKNGLEKESVFQRWTIGRKSYELNILTADPINGGVQNQDVPGLRLLEFFDEAKWADARYAINQEKDRNSDGIIRIKWVSFAWDLSEVGADVNTDHMELGPLYTSNVSVPMYFSVMYGPADSPKTFRVLAEMNYHFGFGVHEQIVSGFDILEIVPEAYGAGGPIEGFGLVRPGRAVENQIRAAQLIKDVALPLLAIDLEQDQAFREAAAYNAMGAPQIIQK